MVSDDTNMEEDENENLKPSFIINTLSTRQGNKAKDDYRH